MIASDLDALNGSFEGLREKVRKLVPCLCSRCKASTSPERFEEARLLKRKQDGKLRIECPESYENVNVLELLDGLRSGALPQWAMAPPEQPPAAAEPLKTIKIFLASSSELREDRDAFDLYFRQQNDRFRMKGIYLQVERWETFLDAMSETRKQDDYNEKVRSCDVFVSLFKTKTGKFTEEEFDVAHAAFQESGKPLIYTYFMQTDVPNDKALREPLNSLWAFQDKLTNLGHYQSFYSSIEDLKLKFKDQLESLIDEGKI